MIDDDRTRLNPAAAAGSAPWLTEGTTAVPGAPTLVPPGTRAQASSAGAPPPAPGDLIGDFRVVQPLGSGGMGCVVRARQVSLGREVALKVLHHDKQSTGQAPTNQAMERFVREGRSAASVLHPNVVTTFAAGKDEATGRLFIAMELVQGGDAERLCERRGGRLPELEALALIRDCARGLGALEAAGLVHRDIKPENIFLGKDGTAKLGDLGLARRAVGDDRLTATGLVVGTPVYMAPEQALGNVDLDVRTDVYGLGATLFRLVSGKKPLENSRSIPHLLARIVSEPAPDVREVAPDVSDATAALLLRLMAKEPALRPASAAALLAELETTIAELRAGRTSPGASLESDGGGHRPPGPRLSPLALGLIVAALLGALVALGIAMAQGL